MKFPFSFSKGWSKIDLEDKEPVSLTPDNSLGVPPGGLPVIPPLPTFPVELPHNHEWELVGKTFCEPKTNVTFQNDADLNKLALVGKTNYIFQCKTCPEFKKVEADGLEATALDGLLDKVDAHGPEFVVRGDSTYVIAKQQQPLTQIPLR